MMMSPWPFTMVKQIQYSVLLNKACPRLAAKLLFQVHFAMAIPAAAHIALLATFAVSLGTAQCVNRTASPVDPAVLGKSMITSGCSAGSSSTSSELRIHAWGILWRPWFDYRYNNGCPEEITAVFTKRDTPAMLYHRPPVKAVFFKKSHPKMYAAWENSRFVHPAFPCGVVKAVHVPVWGPKRALFMKLVARMVRDIRSERDDDCGVPFLSQRNFALTKMTPSKVRKFLERYNIANNAVAYLHNLAFSNYFCV